MFSRSLLGKPILQFCFWLENVLLGLPSARNIIGINHHLFFQRPRTSVRASLNQTSAREEKRKWDSLGFTFTSRLGNRQTTEGKNVVPF